MLRHRSASDACLDSISDAETKVRILSAFSKKEDLEQAQTFLVTSQNNLVTSQNNLSTALISLAQSNDQIRQL